MFGFSQDFVINKGGNVTGSGPVAELLASTRFDPGLLRPYLGEDNHTYVTVNTKRSKRIERRRKDNGQLISTRMEPIYEQVRVNDLRASGVQLPSITTNATSLRKEEWLMYDQALIPPQRQRLRLYNDIAAMDTLSFSGLGVKIIEHETMSDPGRAYMDMDGLSEGTDDTPLFQLEGTPVPVFHANFKLDLRTLESSRRSGMPLSTRGISWATRRVAELVETNAIGIPSSPLLYGGNSTQVGGYGRTSGVYGLINFPGRLTSTALTIPTGSNPEVTIADILTLRTTLYNNNFFGPYGIYHSTDWDTFLDNDYARLGGDNASMTLRQRILKIGVEEGDGGTSAQRQIKFVKRLDYLTPANSHAFTMIMVSLDPNVIQALNGMPITVFQYETHGGWQMHFRVACINLVRMFTDYNGNCGILHARTP